MTATQATAWVIGSWLVVCVVYDLVFCRPERRARRSAEVEVERLHRELDRRDRGDALRQVGPMAGHRDRGDESGTAWADVVQLPASRPGPRRRSRRHPSTYQGRGA